VSKAPLTNLGRMIRQGRSFSSHERNCCFLNLRGGGFATLSATSGLDFPDDGRAIALVDWDRDGDLDLWFSNRNAPRLRLMLNNTPSRHSSIELLLVGNGKTTNRDAIGARVEVVHQNSQSSVAQPKSIRTLRAGEGFLAQSSKWIHIGLGDAANIEKVIVRWPGGGTEEFAGAQVKGHYRLVQGTGQAEPWQNQVQSVTLAPGRQTPLPDSDVARIPLTLRLPLPTLEYQTFDGSSRAVSSAEGESLWIVLWASWCQPCLQELQEITDRQKELRLAGIDVLALAVDGVGADQSNPQSASQCLGRVEFPFRSGRATTKLIDTLQTMHDMQILTRRSLPVPSSFLIDQQGALVALYKGPTTVADVVEDLRNSNGTWHQRFARASPLPGRVIDAVGFEQLAKLYDARTRIQFVRFLSDSNFVDDAGQLYQAVLQFAPDSYEAHNNLGTVHFKKGMFDEADAQYRRAIELKPDLAEGYFNLA